MFTLKYSIANSSCFRFCSVLLDNSPLHFHKFIKMDCKYLNALKLLMSVSSAILIFISVVIVITFLPICVSVLFSSLYHSFSVCLL